MSQGLSRTDVDQDLLAKFTSEIKAHVPHIRDGKSGTAIINPTPLVDITDSVLDCARTEFDLDFSTRKAKVFGKFDSQIFGSSVKVRPAVQIIEEAIATGKLRTGQTVFEATSGNFGLALGMLEKLGLRVVVLVSRKLQEGVVEELKKKNVKTVDLDVDICPAPGLKVDQNIFAAKVTAENLKQELVQIGLDGAVFDSARGEIEGLLARQDVINLAKFLAKAYGGFSPEQYDNELNVKSHETVTGPEIDQQVRVLGYSLDDFRVVTTFGTGGTSAGLSNYTQAKYARKTVHVVFPLGNQDVAGIRARTTRPLRKESTTRRGTLAYSRATCTRSAGSFPIGAGSAIIPPVRLSPSTPFSASICATLSEVPPAIHTRSNLPLSLGRRALKVSGIC